ncbi:EAL domain-containing protein [bacterium]|nr:EAL domain-containing protein [bacterium]
MKIYKISEFANKIGVSTKTLHRWDMSGKLKAHRTPSNHRYYTHQQYMDYITSQNISNDINLLKLIESSPCNMAIIQVDIDGFKTLNALYGESACDEILDYIDSNLKSFINNTQHVLNRSADVFTILHEYTDETALIDIIKSWDEILSNYKKISYRLTWGIYFINQNDDTLSTRTLLDRASIARKSVKGYALNNIGEYKKQLQDQIDKIQNIESKMFKALENNEFVLYIQPKYNIHLNKIVGGEALVRWIESDGNVIMPNDFIPIFEKNSFVVNTDRFIWEEVCKTLARWKNEGVPLIPISINVSRKNLVNTDLVDYLENLINTYEIDKKYIEIEITESLNDSLSSKAFLDLKNKGFVLLMDDFGSGYSSLNTLKNTDFDVIKLDKQFLSKFMHNSRGQKIIAHTILMIKDINLGVIAEGVETEEQAAFLEQNGCDIAQGFLYSKPLTVSDFENLLKNNSDKIEVSS